MLHAQINISKDDLHVSAWLWTLPLTEEKKNGFSFDTDGEELKNSSMISVSLESSAVQERLEAAIYQALCLHLITSPHHSALYSYCAYVVLKSYSKRTHKARS